MYVRNYVCMCKSKNPFSTEHTHVLAQLASCPQTQIVSVYECVLEKNDREQIEENVARKNIRWWEKNRKQPPIVDHTLDAWKQKKTRENEREKKKLYFYRSLFFLQFFFSLSFGFVIWCLYSINRRISTTTLYYWASYSFSKSIRQKTDRILLAAI